MKTVIELKANVDNGEIDKRLRYFFKNKGYGIRWKDGICLITKTGIRGRRCFKVLCNGKDYRIEAFYKAFFQPGFIYNKSYYTGSQPDTCINLQSKGWYFLLLYLPQKRRRDYTYRRTDFRRSCPGSACRLPDSYL